MTRCSPASEAAMRWGEALDAAMIVSSEDAPFPGTLGRSG
jgi:hypothetical protein